MKYVYASLCGCGHLTSRHHLTADGDLRAGPYRCKECGCEQPQDGDFTPLSKRQFEEWEAAQGVRETR